MRILIAFILLTSYAWAAEKDQVLIIVEEIGAYQKCLDPEACTSEELEAQEAWQARHDNFMGVKNSMTRANGWAFSGDWNELIHEDKGLRVTKGGKTYRAYTLRIKRIKKPHPTFFVETEVTMMKQDWDFKAWTINKPKDEIPQKGYVRAQVE